MTEVFVRRSSRRHYWALLFIAAISILSLGYPKGGPFQRKGYLDGEVSVSNPIPLIETYTVTFENGKSEYVYIRGFGEVIEEISRSGNLVNLLSGNLLGTETGKYSYEYGEFFQFKHCRPDFWKYCSGMIQEKVNSMPAGHMDLLRRGRQAVKEYLSLRGIPYTTPHFKGRVL